MLYRIAAAAIVGAAAGSAAVPQSASGAAGGLLPVPAVTIQAGERITADKLTEKHFYYDPDRPLGVVTDPSAAIGKAARRTLIAGKPIPHNAFRTLRLVKRGQLTAARLREGGLTITTTVLPETDGGEGDIVRARNIDTRRIITGIVAADGTVEVRP